ncbi:2'-5' RNA ligase family protein [Streptomyces sp. SL13]|uniref:2'-5' RNA ligase family protein n=1 Tax=Streptantibioticus silvisoli TaxID=2705255 RepID=A0AA90GZU2_9ACTN|nr:2'-5' RNA ligase family protein [Streptantibioticus silvisoli]MDI5965833.1 2'-5' RNA ligase family protein [Streptantibioticus silvisoli]MDI5971343.1 2'-5' RNA ligase family protein [Streptantibioticus silvisoli]
MGSRTIGVSVAVPEPYGSLLQRRRAGFGDRAAYAIPSHVTLLPPTEADEDLLPEFARHLAAVAEGGRAFPLRLSGTGTFRPLTPVVFVTLAEGAPDCARLQERVRSGPVSRELDFPYHPHVTVAHGIAPEALDRAQCELAAFSAAWTVTGFALYQQDAGGVWHTLREFPFGRPPGAPAALPHQYGTRPGADAGGRLS